MNVDGMKEESYDFGTRNNQQSQQAQLDAIRDAFKANKDEGAVIAKPAAFKGDADDVARFLPMFRNWATEQKALRIKAGPGVPPADVGKLDHRRTIQSALSFCEGGKAGRVTGLFFYVKPEEIMRKGNAEN
ncbi:hypothetical protein PQX77_022258 [Marasmius sp. AFHP31]|nr:hypothetical protein PQX77_022258 [Marasmius sp. AFHP31]